MPIAPHNACKKARNGSNVTISLCCLNVLFPWVPVNGTGTKVHGKEWELRIARVAVGKEGRGNNLTPKRTAKYVWPRAQYT